jgi:hypothetical protein
MRHYVTKARRSDDFNGKLDSSEINDIKQRHNKLYQGYSKTEINKTLIEVYPL